MFARPIMIMGFVFILGAVFISLDNSLSNELIGLSAISGITFIIVDMELKKLKTRLEKPETPSAPPVTEEA